MQPATVPVPSPHRFFAVTAERLELIARHSLTMADVSVWAFIELTSKPGILRQYQAADVAAGGHVSLSVARRAITRLAEVGVIMKRRRSHGLWLCPSAQPFAKDDTSAPEPRQQPKTATHERRQTVSHGDSELPKQATHNGGNIVVVLASAAPSENLELTEGEANKAFDLKERTGETASPPIAAESQAGDDDLIATLERELGIWAKVGRRLVATFGAATVGERLTWARWLRDQGKAENPGGYLQAALRGSYAPPDGFHAAQQAPTPQRRPLDEAAVIARVMTIQSAPDRYTDDEKTEALRNACLVGKEAAAMRLAAAWGLSL